MAFAGIAVLANGVALAQPPAVSVNDRPLGVAVVMENGRVLVPMRAIFNALGATVSYDSAERRISAATAAHRVVLPVGARFATVDGRSVRLDVPARVIALQTYVPLRFVSQALGAMVGYDMRANVIAVATAPTASSAARVVGMNPPEGSRVASAYPVIGASLSGTSAQPGSVRLLLDGTDVANLASFDGRTITYIPRASLSQGSHTVSFSGTDSGGASFDQSWSFQTTIAGSESGYASQSSLPFEFYNDGNEIYRNGDSMQFTLVAPPGGSAYLQLCGLGYDYPFWNGGTGTYYRANVPVPIGYAISSCEVTAVYTAWNGRRTYVPYPIYIGIYTQPAPRLQPTPVPVSLPPGPARRIEPIGRRPGVDPVPVSVPPASVTRPVSRETPRPEPVRVPPPIVDPPERRARPVEARPLEAPPRVPNPKATP